MTGPFSDASVGVARLSHVADIVLGKMIQSEPIDGGIEVPYIKAANVRDHAIEVDDLGTMWATDREIEQLDVRVGDIFVIEGGATAGRAALVRDAPPPNTVFQNAVHRIRAREGIDQRFLFYVLRALSRTGWYEALCSAATFKHLTGEKMADLPVPVLALRDQRRIAAYLDEETRRLDVLARKNLVVQELLQERIHAVLESAIYQFGAPSIPLMSLVDSSRPIMYGIVLPGPNVEDGVPLIKGGDVHSHNLDIDSLNRVDAAIEAEHVRSRVEPGDLLYAIRGSFGDVEMMPTSLGVANITQDVARVAPGSGVYGPWLLYALRAPRTRSQARRASVGATISGVNIRDLKRFKIPTPPPDEQRTIAARLDDQLGRIEELRRTIDDELALIEERRQALITAAVTGQIDVTAAGRAA